MRDINLNWIEFQKWLEQESEGSPYIAVVKAYAKKARHIDSIVPNGRARHHIVKPSIWRELWYIFRGRYLPPSVACKVSAEFGLALGDFSFCGYPVLQAGFYIPCGRIATEGCAYCELHAQWPKQ